MKRKNINDLDFTDILDWDYFERFLIINYDLSFLNDLFKTCDYDLSKFGDRLEILIDEDWEYLEKNKEEK